MSYINRTIEDKFLRMNKNFKVVLLTGARQVGKTTMLKHLAREYKRGYVSMDDFDIRRLASEDPKLFLKTFARPPYYRRDSKSS